MKSILRTTQKFAIPVILVIALALLAAFSDQDDINDKFGAIVGLLATVTFVSLPDAISGLWSFLKQLPLVILVLVGGSLYFTLRFNFINIIGFWHAIEVVTGKYDNPDDPGEVSHFQALSSALSATVGLGNIAGVAIAVSIGGPGAIFWMMMTAFFGMTSKFAECTLGQMYRRKDALGNVSGGPMVYLRDGLEELGWPNLGKYLSVIFAILCIGGSFGGGNMFQANQSFSGMAQLVPWLDGARATGEIELRSAQPLELNYSRHYLRVIRPAMKMAENDDEKLGKKLLYLPTKDLKVSLEDWRLKDGFYVYPIEVKAHHTGTLYNVKANTVEEILFGEYKGPRQVDFAKRASVSVHNATPLQGGEDNRAWLFGLVLMVLVGVVIVGGIQSIGKVAEKIVPLMCGIYLLTGMAVILVNLDKLPGALGIIFNEAFTPAAGIGGLIGVFIQGVKRAAFSSEAGVGSAAIAHSAAKTDEPVREGIVALLEPFIDTIVVCFMTGMVIIITGAHVDPANATLEGVEITSAAFGSVFPWFPYVLSIAVFLFAYSTMISWSYYGERCWTFLFGSGQSMTYRIIFLIFVWIGCVSNMSNVTDFSDLMILAMAFPNIIGVVMLSGKLRDALESYWRRHKAGKFRTFKKGRPNAPQGQTPEA